MTVGTTHEGAETGIFLVEGGGKLAVELPNLREGGGEGFGGCEGCVGGEEGGCHFWGWVCEQIAILP